MAPHSVTRVRGLRPLRRILLTATSIAVVLAGFTGPPATGQPSATNADLTALSVAPGPYRPGDTVTVAYTLTGTDSPAQAIAVFRSVTSTRSFEFVDKTPTMNGSDTFSLTVPAASFTGDYSFAHLVLVGTDGARQYKFLAVRPYFAITGSANDGEPPRLTNLTVVKAATYADEETTYAYTVTDDSAVSRVVLSLANPAISGHPYAEIESPALSGTISLGAGVAGPTSVHAITFVDARGNTSTWQAKGAVQGFVAPHTIDFAPLTVTTRPGRDSSQVRARPRGADVTWFAPATEGKTITGYKVVVNPGGRTYTVGVGSYFAPWDGYRQQLRVSGLTNGVAYTITTSALSQWGEGRPKTHRVTPLLSQNITSPGDVTGDQRADVVALNPAGRLLTDGSSQFVTPIYTYKGTGTGSFAGRSTLFELGVFSRIAARGQADPLDRGSVYYADAFSLHVVDPGRTVSDSKAWSRMLFLDGGSDFSGDGIPDLLAVAPTGELYRYRMDSMYTIRARQQIGSGWQSFLAVFSPGDFNGDRKADVIAVDTAGRMWLYRGNGVGGWLSPRIQIGSGWQGFGAVLPLRDFNGDGRVDIGAVKMTGELLMYPGSGRGGFAGSPRQIGSGWHAFF